MAAKRKAARVSARSARAGAPPGRGRGRPRRDEADQKASLMEAALTCYVRQGIRATSIRDIAREAGVTPALLHYYYRGAPQLLERVIEERLMPVFASVRDAIAAIDDADPMVLATGFVNSVCAAIERHPWWPALWVREVVSEGGALRDLLLLRVAPELTRSIAERFAAAQAAGRLNARLDPRLIVVTLVGLTLFPAAGAPIWRSIFDAGDLTMDDVRRHALAMLASGLEERG